MSVRPKRGKTGLPALLLMVGAMSTISISVAYAQDPSHDTTIRLSSSPQEPVTPIPVSLELDSDKVALGHDLFFDRRMSGDNTRSCAGCHQLPPLKASRPLTSGPALQGDPKRSVPLLYNSGVLYWYNWDGRYRTLEGVVSGSVTQPDKLASSWEGLLERLQVEYAPRFAALYGRGLTAVQVSDVLAEFLRSLSTPNARFDRFLRGEAGVLSADEANGYALFKEIGCSSCHSGVALGGNFFEKFYIYDHDDEESEPRRRDLGRYYLTQDESDRNVFRVPSLRNVAHSAPYFHDGSAADLDEAVEEMGEHQLGVALSEEQRRLLVAFLHTLSADHQGVKP